MSTIFSYLQYPFVRYAFVVALLVAIISSLLGTTLVLKRFSFMGDGLSHAAFGATALASVLGVMNKSFVVMPIIACFSVLLLRSGKRAKAKGDAYLAILSSSALAIGYLLMNLFPVTSNISSDVCSTLFGSQLILTLSKADVLLCVFLSLVIIAVFVFFYNRIFAVTFDEDFAKASGLRVEFYNMLIAITISLVITLAMNLVGSLLVSALIVFPSLCAMKLCTSFKAVTICSAVISSFCAVLGIGVSILAQTPVGASIVALNLIVFAISCIASRIIKTSAASKNPLNL